MSRKYRLKKYVAEDDYDAVEDMFPDADAYEAFLELIDWVPFVIDLYGKIASEEMYSLFKRITKSYNRALLEVVNAFGPHKEFSYFPGLVNDLYRLITEMDGLVAFTTIKFLEEVDQLEWLSGAENVLFEVYGDELPVKLLDVVYAEGGPGRQKQIENIEALSEHFQVNIMKIF